MPPATASSRSVVTSRPLVKHTSFVNIGSSSSNGGVRRESTPYTYPSTEEEEYYVRRRPRSGRGRAGAAEVIEIPDSSDEGSAAESEESGTGTPEMEGEDNEAYEDLGDEDEDDDDDEDYDHEDGGESVSYQKRKKRKISDEQNSRAKGKQRQRSEDGPSLLSTPPSSGGDPRPRDARTESPQPDLGRAIRKSSSSTENLHAVRPVTSDSRLRRVTGSLVRKRAAIPATRSNRNTTTAGRSRPRSTASADSYVPPPPSTGADREWLRCERPREMRTLLRRGPQPQVVVPVHSSSRANHLTAAAPVTNMGRSRISRVNRRLHSTTDSYVDSDHSVHDGQVAGPSRPRLIQSAPTAAQKGKGRASTHYGKSLTGWPGFPSSDIEMVSAPKPAAKAIVAERTAKQAYDPRIDKNQLVTRAYDLDDELCCSICLEIMISPVNLTCGHTFCQSCIVPWLDDNASSTN